MACAYRTGVIGAVLIFGTSSVSLAQTPAYETPLYSTKNREGLDPNYGMPSFGGKGGEFQPRKQAGSRGQDKPSFWDSNAPRPEIVSRRPESAYTTEMETPSYTTQFGMQQTDPPSYDSSTDTK